MEKTIRHITVFTGAGISAESGLQTFRGTDGLWEGSRIEEVATPEAWHRNPDLVQQFYNIRRKACLEAKPNAAHYAVVELAKYYEVDIITQNIDDLHERAGSTRVLHLHGEIVKSQSSVNPNLTYPIAGTEIRTGDKCALGSQLRPHVVWFGEAVPNMERAFKIVKQTDMLVVIGTSLKVYPAAQLVYEVGNDCEIVVIDPYALDNKIPGRVTYIAEKATVGVVDLVKRLAK
jgi:NAD-dependent deacetylase